MKIYLFPVKLELLVEMLLEGLGGFAFSSVELRWRSILYSWLRPENRNRPSHHDEGDHMRLELKYLFSFDKISATTVFVDASSFVSCSCPMAASP